MFLVHLFLLLFMWWWWGIASPPAVSPAGTEQFLLTLPQEYFQQHFKSIINFIFTNIQLFSREFVTDKTGHSAWVNSKASECQADLIHNSCRSESSNTCLVAVLDKDTNMKGGTFQTIHPHKYKLCIIHHRWPLISCSKVWTTGTQLYEPFSISLWRKVLL